MAGCFGNNPEDRYFERELDKYLDKPDVQDRIEDLYIAKMAELPTIPRDHRYSYLSDVMGSLDYDGDIGLLLGRALRDGDTERAGSILLGMVQAFVREEAADAAYEE